MFEFWTTKEGEKLRIANMDVPHIQNCIHMLKTKINGAYFGKNEENDHYYKSYIEAFQKELDNRGGGKDMTVEDVISFYGDNSLLSSETINELKQYFSGSNK